MIALIIFVIVVVAAAVVALFLWVVIHHLRLHNKQNKLDYEIKLALDAGDFARVETLRAEKIRLLQNGH